MKNLLEKNDLPWSETFVSLFVLLPGEDITALHETFGYPFELRLDRVISDVALVCSDDVQNWIRSSKPPKIHQNLMGMNTQEKLEALRTARIASNERAEARMNRALRLDDIAL